MATDPAQVDVVLPCLDEAASLPWVLSRLPAGYRAIVADNGSTDGSAAIAAAHGATVVPVPQRGFGAAAHAGLEAATAEFVCFCDADGSMDPAQLPRVLDPVRAGRRRTSCSAAAARSAGAWPVHARIANVALARMMRGRTGLRLHDLGPDAGRPARGAAWASGITDRRFGYPLEMVTRAADAGWRVHEVDVDYGLRTAGSRSKVTGTVLGTVRTVRDMRGVLAR